MTNLAAVLDHLDADQDAALDRLFDLIRTKSISTDPAFKDECRKAAETLTAQLIELGFDAALRDTPGHPMVVGHRKDHPDGSVPHVLFYGHYDVQPVDPLELWEADPFDPRIVTRDDGSKFMVARGTSDDKGQLMTFIEAARAWIAQTGALPVNVTVFLEGEEESGSPSLVPFLQDNKDELSCDVALVCDTGMWDTKTPAITATLRGMVSQEVTITAADRDLHSGLYGGAARNPIHVLTDVLAALHDETGRVTIPGFYDGVEETPTQIKAQWETLGATPESFLGPIGLSLPSGEQGRSILEQTWARPTCEVNGIYGGYTGAGFKTVIASKASAKISCRLVHKQDPLKIADALQVFIRERLPVDCSAEFQVFGHGSAIAVSTDSPVVQKAQSALTDEWENPAVVIGMGGSIPVVGEFQSILGMDSLLIGFALDDDRIHSPNEKYELESFQKGTRSWARVLGALGEA